MKIYDISVPLKEDNNVVWEDGDGLHIIKYADLKYNGYNSTYFKSDSHLGTHFDASLHFIENGKTCKDYSVEQFIGKCYVVSLDVDGSITDADLEAKNIPLDVDKLLIKANNIFDDENFKFNKNYSALCPKSAKWVVDRGIKLVGIDYLSIEEYENNDFETHKILLGNDVLVLESLDLREVEEGVYQLYALPLKLADTEAAPVRAILIKE